MAEDPGVSKFAARVPCKSCPYRRRVKRAYWDADEYANLLEQDADPVYGRVFGCHEDGRKAPVDVRPCVGWVRDQVRRDFPSIQYRLMLIHHPAAQEQSREVVEACAKLDLYDSIEEMAEANYPELFPRR